MRSMPGSRSIVRASATREALHLAALAVALAILWMYALAISALASVPESIPLNGPVFTGSTVDVDR